MILILIFNLAISLCGVEFWGNRFGYKEFILLNIANIVRCY